MDQERCRELIIARARADSFLSQSDEQGLVDEHLDQLVALLEQSRSEIRERLEDLEHQLSRRLEAVHERLEKSIEWAEDLISADIRARPQEIARALEREVTVLYRRVFVSLDRSFKAVSPGTDLIPGIVNNQRRLYEEESRRFPYTVTLIRTREGESLRGQSLLSREKETLLRNCCRPPLFLSTFRYLLQRFRLARHYRVIHVPLRRTAEEYLLDYYSPAYEELVEQHSGVHFRCIETLQESWQVIRYNLEMAIADLSREASERRIEDESLLTTGREEMVELTSGALKRAQQKLRSLSSAYGDFFQSVMEVIEREQVRDVESIRLDIQNAGSVRVRSRWAWRDVKKNLREAEKLVQQGAARGKDLSFRIAGSIYYFLEDVFDSLARMVGLPVESRERLLALADLPDRSQIIEQIRSLPPIYWRLFSFEPLTTQEFMVGKDPELKALEATTERWRNGRVSSVVIVGPEGSGKTSLLNCYQNQILQDEPCLRLEIPNRLRSEEEVLRMVEGWFDMPPESNTEGELAERLRQLPRQILLIEGGHRLLLRTIGGQQTAETFFHLLVSTRDHFLWVISIRDFPWNKLQYLLQASRYFTHEIQTPFHDKQAQREAILLRQKSSGYPILYLDEGLEDRKLRKLLLRHDLESPPVQQYLEERFFDDLFQVTGGNMRAAVFFWLNALEFQDQEERVHVRPCMRLNYDFIRDFEREYLFTLAELINHGGLSVREHSEVFRIDPDRSRAILESLMQMRLVEIDQSSSDHEAWTYSVNSVLVHPVVQNLLSLNALY